MEREDSHSAEEERSLELLRSISEGKGRPLDTWEVTALLETNGLRDVDARTDWTLPDLFILSERLLPSAVRLDYPVKETKLTKHRFGLRVTLNYLKGMLFAVPMIVQILSMIVIGVGIWSSINFTIRDATIIGLATLLALATTGGAAQIIGRKGLFYIKLQETLLASMITKRLYLLSVSVIIMTAFAFAGMNLYFQFFPFSVFSSFILYYVLLSLFFLALSVFYMLEQYGTIALITILGIVLVYLFYVVLGKEIFFSQYVSLGIIVVLANILGFYQMRRLRKKAGAEGTLLPKVASLFYTLYSYFAYGSLYFLFLIMDRMLAWTTGKQYLPSFIWFNYPYEVGVDWALIPLIFTIALVEVFIYELGIFAFNRMNETPASQQKNFNAHFIRIYVLGGLTFFIVGVISIILSYFFPFFLSNYSTFFQHLGAYFNRINIMVFFFASAGYVLLSWALLNCIIFFAYSRPNFAIKSIAAGTFVNFVVGYIFSRAFDYYYAIIGLTAGGIVFAAVSTYYAYRFFRRYDYYYYSAY